MSAVTTIKALVFPAVFVAYTCALAADPLSPTIAGRWATQGFDAVVELRSCADAADALCGWIAWLWDAVDKKDIPRVDRQNPDESLRTRPLVGTEMLRGFRQTAPGIWTGGSVYDPGDGRTYSGSIKLNGDGTLRLEGCALWIFCRSEVWRRPADIVEQAER